MVLTYTTPTEIIRAYPMEAVYYSNKEKKELSHEPLVTKGGEPYVSLEFAALFSDMTYTFYEKPARVLIRTESKDMLSLKAEKKTVVREAADIKSRIVYELPEDSVVWYVDAGTEADAKFVKVMTEDGVFGFVRKKDLGESYHESYVSEYSAPVYSQISADGKVVLAVGDLSVEVSSGAITFRNEAGEVLLREPDRRPYLLEERPVFLSSYDENTRVEEAKRAAAAKIQQLEDQLRACLQMLSDIREANRPAPVKAGPGAPQMYDYDQESGAAEPAVDPADAVADEISSNLAAMMGTTEDTAPKAEPRHPVQSTTSRKFDGLKFGPNYDPTNPDNNNGNT